MATAVAYSDPPLGAEAAELGELIRTSRAGRGLTLLALAERVGTSKTTLSLLERGRRAVHAGLLDRIAAELGADTSTVFRLAGMVPPAAVTQVLGAEVAHALSGGALVPEARRVLRRVHLGHLAAELTAGVLARPVPVMDLMYKRLDLDVREIEGLDWPRFDDMVVEYPAGLEPAERQFQLAHMAGHALLVAVPTDRKHCHHGRRSRDEGEATWLAGLVTMPRPMLEDEFRTRAAEYGTGSPDDIAAAVADVAGAFAIPYWLALRHIVDAGLLEWAFGEGPA